MIEQAAASVKTTNFLSTYNIKRHCTNNMWDNRHEIYGACFFKHSEEIENSVTQKNLVVFAAVQIDRSPCGSGTAVHVAVLLAQGSMHKGKVHKHYSIIDTMFEAGLETSSMGSDSIPICVPWTRGTARLISRINFYIDPRDPLYPGFLLR